MLLYGDLVSQATSSKRRPLEKRPHHGMNMDDLQYIIDEESEDETKLTELRLREDGRLLSRVYSGAGKKVEQRHLRQLNK